MITAIHKSMAAKRDAIKNDEQGFTLIELLVVVLIIGILSAIAIPVFLGQQEQAKEAAIKSDLASAKTAVISYATSHNGTYPTVVGDLTGEGFVPSANVTIAIVSATSAGLCLSGDHSETAAMWYITDTTGATTTVCT